MDLLEERSGLPDLRGIREHNLHAAREVIGEELDRCSDAAREQRVLDTFASELAFGIGTAVICIDGCEEFTHGREGKRKGGEGRVRNGQ
jgi:hypothetical protein